MKVLLGIAGSIAAYKSLELVRFLRKEGAEVKIILTKSALNFVTTLSCQTLSDNEVYLDQFVLTKDIKHLTLSDWADILVIAPATANIVGKTASGIGDDLLSTIILSFHKPILFVPAMDEGMWQNKIVQKNKAFLANSGYHFLEPMTGPLASGKIGKGRFPPVVTIYKKILTVLTSGKSLDGKKFLIAGGRTEEDVDPVRVITNRSSGRMAIELMDAVISRGGRAKAIMGEISVPLTEGYDIMRVRTSQEMLRQLKKDLAWCDCLIMSAAVGDYKPKRPLSTKAHNKKLRLDLEKNQDLLKTLRPLKGKRIFVGFSLEDENNIKRAREKLQIKGLDFIVLNTTAAIGADHTAAQILRRDGKTIKLDKISKFHLANQILDECAKAFENKNTRH